MAWFSSTVCAAFWGLIVIGSSLSAQACQIRRPGQPSGQIPGSQQPERALSSRLILMLGQGSGCTRKTNVPSTLWLDTERLQARLQRFTPFTPPILNRPRSNVSLRVISVSFWKSPGTCNEYDIKKKNPDLVAIEQSSQYILYHGSFMSLVLFGVCSTCPGFTQSLHAAYLASACVFCTDILLAIMNATSFFFFY